MAEDSAINPAGPARKPSGLSPLLLHLHPKMVPEEALAFPRTFGLGGIALVLFGLLAVTGALLLFGYDPSPERAYASVQSLVMDVPFGAFVRNAHHWSAAGLLVVAGLHLLRVVYTGAFRPPRRANWFVGLALLLLVVQSSFTGYLMPWDQLSYWAVTIGTGMLAYVPVAGEALMRMARGGGADIGPRTLSLYFVLHVAILPLAMFFLMSLHFWFVRKAGGVTLPPTGGRRTLVPATPDLVLREGVAALVAIAAVLVWSAVAYAPLLAPANPGMSPNPAKAPWYFMGLQELLVHLHPVVAVVIMPIAAIAFLLAMPSLAADEPATGRYFHSPAGGRTALLGALAALAVVPLWILASDRLRRGLEAMTSLPAVVRTGLVPLIAFAVILAAVYLAARRAAAGSALAAVQAVFTFLAVGFLVLTVTGAVFRGQGMALVWPW
jgi:quinol-cytochrome oxidoreductase complex cytochrome b subunit